LTPETSPQEPAPRGADREPSPPGARARPVTIRWTEDGRGVRILDQTELPERRVERELRSVGEVEEAIRSLRVRGAPLIGITAAMGVAALARDRAAGGAGPDTLRESVETWCDRLAGARPTAVNLRWALGRVREAAREAAVAGGRGSAGDTADGGEPGPGERTRALVDRLREEAETILREDREMCRRIGEHALELLRPEDAVVTHCNAGALATGGIGTALAPIYLARERGWSLRVYADETRPLLQGSRLTVWELEEAGVDVTVMADSMAGTLMAQDPPDAVLVGADRIAANGDVANKVGTYGLAVLAEHHGVPFYVLAPTSTVDLETPGGAEIPIEHRSADEIRRGFGRLTAPEDAPVFSPAFDITPAGMVDAIVTERGVARPPYGESLREAVASAEAERRAVRSSRRGGGAEGRDPSSGTDERTEGDDAGG